jgi:CBS domain-containing protein
MKKLNLFLIDEKSTIKNAIIKIRKNGARTLVVVNKKRKLQGTISEGDIQKSILKNIKISTKITNIYNKDPKKIRLKKIDKKKIKEIFLNKQYGILPIVDNFNIVKKIITWDDVFNLDKKFFKLKNINVVIMAGGKGERLKPLTEILPKPLVPINNKPMLEHIIESLKYFNFNKFFLILNHQADLIKSYFINNYKNLNINYIKEKNHLEQLEELI